MLRTKPLGTFSNYARSFIISNSRCGTGDGASCACSEDDTSISKKQQTSNSNCSVQERKTNVLHAAAVPSGSPSFRLVAGSNQKTPENGSYTVAGSHILAVTPPQAGLSSFRGKASTSGDDGETVRVGPIFMVKHFVDEGNTANPRTDGRDRVTHQDGRPSKGKQQSQTASSYSETRLNSSINLVRSSGQDYQNRNKCGAKAAKPASDSAKTRPGDAVTPVKSYTQQQPHRAKAVVKSRGGGLYGRNAAVPDHGNVRSAANRFCHPTNPMGSRTGGFSHSNSSAGPAVERYRQTLQQLEWGRTAEVMLNNLPCKLDVFQANQVLKLLRDSSVALGFFNWLKHQPGYRHDVHTYTTMIGILGHAREFDAMRMLLEEMTQVGCHPTVVTYNRLIHAYGRANFINEAVGVFHHMQEAGYEPDRVTYCTLIDIHAKAGYLEVALDLYDRMQGVGLSPDTFTYSVMINCLGKGGHLAAADKLFSKMIEQGCVPNIVTYNIMIALQARARNYPSVVKLYQGMQTSGFRPDKVTYNIVMEVLGHCGRLEEAEAVYFEMRRDWDPDEPVYGLLVDLWGKAGNVNKARSWYQAMLSAGLRPNVPTTNSLLSAFLKARQFDDAYAVLQNMMRLGLIPSLQTYTLLLSCCTEMWSDMGLCCRLMAITGHPAHAFLASLPDAEPGGHNVRNHASSFLDLLHCEDRESKRGLLDAIIDFLHKSGLKEEAGLVWEVVAERNVYPGSVKKKGSAYWLINLHVMSDGTAVTAVSRTLAWFRRQLLDSGFGPSRIDIITGWGRRSRVTGTSLVRQSVGELLSIFDFPFLAANGNSGCFVGCGEPLSRWLRNPYVERMHLL